MPATWRAIEKVGGKALAVQADVAREADVIAIFDAAAQAFGAIDGVVNNAGTIVSPPMPLAEMSAERLEKPGRCAMLGQRDSFRS